MEKQTKKQAIKEAVKKCQECGSINNLELHHRDYFKEGNVTILCRKCHRCLHRKYK